MPAGSGPAISSDKRSVSGARLWDVLPGFLSAPILWLTALYDLFESRRVVLQARKALPA